MVELDEVDEGVSGHLDNPETISHLFVFEK